MAKIEANRARALKIYFFLMKYLKYIFQGKPDDGCRLYSFVKRIGLDLCESAQDCQLQGS